MAHSLSCSDKAQDPASHPESPIFTRSSAKNLSPYAYLGLWRNPFGEFTASERAALAVVETNKMREHLADSRHAVQIMGGCGFGKTTHLLALQSVLPGAELVYFPEDGPRPRLPATRPLLIDEGQRLSWLQKRKLWSSDGPLVLTTHVDLSGPLSRAGFQVLSLDVEQPKSPEMLAEILNRRIGASRICHNAAGASPEDHSQRELPTIDLCYAEQLLARFGSNVRSIEHHLYEQFQRSVREKEPWPPAT